MAITDVLLFANNKSAELGADLAAIDTGIVLATGLGAGFPSPAAGQYFVVTVQNLTTGAVEICHCTSRTGDILTVLRAQEGTAAQTFTIANAIVQMRMTKGMLEKLLQRRFDASEVGKYLRVQSTGEVYPEALVAFGAPPDTRLIATQYSLTGGGDLTADRTLSLVGDSASPGNNMLYGTNAAGTRGWRVRPYVMRGAAFVSNAILTPAIPPVSIHFTRAATIRRVVLIGDTSGSCTVEIKKTARVSYTGPTSGTSIVAADAPSISGALTSDKTSFTGWTLDVAADDVLNISLPSVSLFTRLTVQIFFEESF